MGETLVRYQTLVNDPDGRTYEARACGAPMPDGRWEGWVEFIPSDKGDAVRSTRETTQPNRTDTEYWATGLTPIYLEGSLARALREPIRAKTAPPPTPSIFPEPAPSIAPPSAPIYESVLNPFSVYQKGEALLRAQLGAMSAWHLVQIALDYALSKIDIETLNRMSQPELIELIVDAVRRDHLLRADVSAR